MPRVSTTKPDAFSRALAAEYRAERARQGMDQTELARRVGKSDSYVSTRLRGERVLSASDLFEFTRALGMDMQKLISIASDVAARERSMED